MASSSAWAANRFESAKKCGECHSGIYSEWKDSMHALSLEDPVFRASFDTVTRPEDRRYCLSCHAPITQITGDDKLSDPVAREGVTCDFCHSVTDLLPMGPGLQRYKVQPGDTKWGPFQPSELTEKGHKNAFSPLHKKGEFCGGCHEVINAHGLHVMNTYEEWSTGPYPGSGTACQNCHMPEDIRFTIVDRDVAPSTKTVTSHSVMGGHSQIRVGNAAKISVLAERKGQGLEAIVYVTNSESGHAIPTGLPARKLVLTARLVDEKGRLLGARDLVYRRILADRSGAEIPNESITDMFLNSVKVISDNRVRPQETRRETFQFNETVPPGPFSVEAVLTYEFHPQLPGNHSAMQFAMARDKFHVPAKKQLPGKTILMAAAAVLMLFVGWMAFRRRTPR